MHDGTIFHIANMAVNILPSNQSGNFTLATIANSLDLKSKFAYLGHYLKSIKDENLPIY